MFEEEKDDALMQLFRRSEPNLGEEMPSSSVWDRIEKRLNAQPVATDTEAPTKSPPNHLTIETNANAANAAAEVRMRPRFFYAAAAVLACVLSLGAVWQMFYLSPQDKVLADMRSAEKANATAPKSGELSEVLPVNEAERQALYKIEDSMQALNLAKNDGNDAPPRERPQPLLITDEPEKTNTLASGGGNNSAPLPAPSPSKSADNKPTDVHSYSLTNPTVEPSKSTTNGAAVVPSTTTTAKTAKSDTAYNGGISADDFAMEESDNVKTEQKFASPPNTQADKLALEEAEDLAVVEAARAKGSARKEKDALDKKEARTRTNATIQQRNAAANPNSAPRTLDEKAVKIHPRLQMFAWLLGRWSEQRVDGTSYEEWQLKSNTIITGKGYKIKDGDKLFEETMMIFFDEKLQQIFLSISIDDHKTPTFYLLTGIEGDQITFKNDQVDNGQPQKITFQRTPTGYTVVVANEKTELKTEQQSFLNHRNAVSNTRAQRNLQPAGR